MNETVAHRGQSQTQTFLSYPGTEVRETRIQMAAPLVSARLWGGHLTAQNLSFVLRKIETVIISTSQGTYED